MKKVATRDLPPSDPVNHHFHLRSLHLQHLFPSRDTNIHEFFPFFFLFFLFFFFLFFLFFCSSSSFNATSVIDRSATNNISISFIHIFPSASTSQPPHIANRDFNNYHQTTTPFFLSFLFAYHHHRLVVDLFSSPSRNQHHKKKLNHLHLFPLFFRFPPPHFFPFLSSYSPYLLANPTSTEPTTNTASHLLRAPYCIFLSSIRLPSPQTTSVTPPLLTWWIIQSLDSNGLANRLCKGV